MTYRYEVQRREETARPRGAGVERRGGRNCGTYRGERWKQYAVTNDKDAALDCIRGKDSDWRVWDNDINDALELE